MTEIDRTEVVIGTSLDDSTANKQIDNLEKKLDNLEKPRTIEFDLDTINDTLKKELADVNNQIAELFKKSKSINNIPGIGPAVERKSSLQNALAEIKKLGPGITADKLNGILSSVGFKLSNDTISAITNEGPQQGVQEMKDAALSMHQLAMEYNNLAAEYKNREKDNRTANEVKNITSKMNDIKAQLIKLGVDVKTFKGNASISYKESWDKFQQNNENKENKQENKGSTGKLIGAIAGIQTIFGLIRRIAAQNEKLTTAINNLVTSLAGVLQPIFDWLAAFINTIAGWLGKIFGVTTKTSKGVGNIQRTILGFDEINRLDGESSGGGASKAADPGTLKIDLGKFIKKLLVIIQDLLAEIYFLFIEAGESIVLGLSAVLGGITATIGGLVKGGTDAIVTAVKGVFKTIQGVFKDIKKLVTDIFSSFVDGYKKARNEGKGIIASVFAGLWESIKTTASNFLKIFKDLWENLKKTGADTFKAFNKGFTEGFSAVYKWFTDKVIDPIKKSMASLWDKTIVPIFDKIKTSWKDMFSAIGVNWDNAYKKFIKPIFDAIGKWGSGIASKFSDAFKNIKNAISNVGTSISSAVSSAFTGAKNKITEIFNSISTTISNVWTKKIKPVFDTISSTATSIKTSVSNAFKGLINGIIDFINKVIKGINKLPGVNIAQIQKLSTGGTVTKGQLFIANEKGPELIGNLGNTTAVANSGQISDSIKKGFTEAMKNSSGSTNVYVDGQKLFTIMANRNNQIVRQTGYSPLMI